MKKLLFIAIVALLMTFAGNAHAVIPTIDGLIGAGLVDPLDEWDGAIIQGTDGNEGTITDRWDISNVYMKVITGEASGNGLYFRMDTWGVPTFDGGPGSFQEAVFQFYLDYNGDSAPEFLVDLNNASDPTSRIVGVYSGPPFPGTKIGDDTNGTDNAISSIIEIYVPDTLLSTTIDFSKFGLFAVLDGRGSEGDDFSPNSGFHHPVPEPSSMLLLGMGLFGLVGGAARKRFKA